MSPPSWAVAAARTVVWVALALVLSISNLVFSDVGQGDFTPYLLLSLLGAFTVPAVLIWRRRFPEVVMVITLAASTLLTIGSSTAWVALGSLLRRRPEQFWRDPWLWSSTLAVTAVTYLAVTRDLSSTDSSHSIVGILLEEPPGSDWSADLPWYTEGALTLILMSMVLGVGALTRAHGRINRVEQRAELATEANTSLSEEITRLEERERIARELHDSLGSKLAAVSMLSGALRAEPGGGAAVRSHAEQLQLAAQEATAEMHEIVRTYRSNPAPSISLRDLEDLIATSLRSGAIIQAELGVEASEAAPAAVNRALYRVVQELITNATKHAPHHTLTLHITGGPERGGIQVFASNPIPPAAAPPHPASTGGSGIIGSAERVEQLGGWLHTSAANHTFIVQAWIPWRASAIR